MPDTRPRVPVRQADRDAPLQRDPVIVLGYPHSGAAELKRALLGHTALAFTSGTGILPLCDNAVLTWQRVEGRDSRLSPLAVASIRAMTGALITTLTARTGALRWCETALTHPRCAESFLEIYPSARFLCMHRNCLDVIAEGAAAYPWGFAGSPFQPFGRAYPDNTVAAISAYWTANTEPLLEFEEAHKDSCHRVRYEDLIRRPGQVADAVASFLCLPQAVPQTEPCALNQDPAAAPTSRDTSRETAPVPVDRIPEPLLILVNRLMAAIGYPEIGQPRSPDVPPDN